MRGRVEGGGVDIVGGIWMGIGMEGVDWRVWWDGRGCCGDFVLWMLSCGRAWRVG